MTDKIQKDIQGLRKKIQLYDYQYYVLAQPEMSDYEYDQMYKDLQQLETAYPQYITPDSPTQRVSGEPTKNFPTVRHRSPMLSLANTYSEEELIDFDRRIQENLQPGETYEYVTELKIDGLAISLIYENGIFIQGATRGDGVSGDDVTSNLKTIRSIPLKIYDSQDLPGLFEVRGEVYLSSQAFSRVNQLREESGEPLFANPRNSAAGTLKMQDARVVAKRGLSMFCYQMIDLAAPDQKQEHWTNLEQLKKNNFPVNNHAKICRDITQVLEYCQLWEEERESLPYEIDGVVIKINRSDQQKRLGSTVKAHDGRLLINLNRAASRPGLIKLSGRWGVPVRSRRSLNCSPCSWQEAPYHVQHCTIRKKSSERTFAREIGFISSRVAILFLR